MKKLLALTAVIGSTVAIAGCNGVAESTKMFKELSNSVNIEGNYLKLPIAKPTTLADAPGYTKYNGKMLKTIQNTDVTMMFFNKMAETFDFGILGKEQQKEMTVNEEKYNAKATVSKIDSKNPGYALEFVVSEEGDKKGGKIVVEQVDGFMNVKMHQYVDFLTDDTEDYYAYMEFSKDSFKEVYSLGGVYTYGTINSTATQMEYTTIQVTGADVRTSYVGITSKTVGSTWDGTTLESFKDDKSEITTDKPFTTETAALLTGAKMNNIAFTALTHTNVETYFRNLVESM